MGEHETDHDKMMRLARRCLWIAFAWNDHNFDKNPEQYARQEAESAGVNSAEDAQALIKRAFDQEDPVRAAARDLLEALEAAIDAGLVPQSSAKDGGAVRRVKQVQVADQIRAALSKARGESQ